MAHIEFYSQMPKYLVSGIASVEYENRMVTGISTMQHFPKVSHYFLRNCYLTDAIVETLVNANPDIISLDLSKNKLSRQSVSALLNLRSLKHLNVDNCSIDVDCLRLLAAIPHLESLLIKSSNCIDDHLIAEIINTSDPIKRANFAFEPGMPATVPSLKRLCMFSVKEQMMDYSCVDKKLKSEMDKPRF